jgi:hypothetical protein
MRTSLVIVIGGAIFVAGCTVSRDIVMPDANGREAVGEGVTGLYGLRSHTLLSVQRHCVEDYQKAGYERVSEQRPK